MLKNYTVKVKNVKKVALRNYINYLNSEKHQNHTETKIFNENNDINYYKNEIFKFSNNEENYKLNGKGGRKCSIISKSITFNIPPYYKCSQTQLNTIKKDILTSIVMLYSQNGIEISYNDLYAVIHDQNNPHIHLLVPTLTQSGENIRFITRKLFILELKKIFTKTVDKVLNVSYRDYIPLKKEELEHNKVVKYLQDIRAIYAYYLTLEDSKYYKNQILQIDRVIQENPKILNEQIQTIIKNTEKVNQLRNEYKKPSKNFPIFS